MSVHLTRAAKLRLLNFLSLFRDLQKPTRFSGGGGGGSGRNFPWSPRYDAIQRGVSGGGVVPEFVSHLQEPTWFSVGGGSGMIFSVARSHFYPTLSGIRGFRQTFCLNTTKKHISCAETILLSNSLNSGSFLHDSGRPGGRARFLETPGNSGRLGRSASPN